MTYRFDLVKSFIGRKESDIVKLVNDGKNIIVATKQYKKSMYKQMGQNATKTTYNLKAFQCDQNQGKIGQDLEGHNMIIAKKLEQEK